MIQMQLYLIVIVVHISHITSEIQVLMTIHITPSVTSENC